MSKGRVTIPSEANFFEETKRLMELWGADAIRDSDGTKLDEQLKTIGAKIYTTYFVARSHNEFIEKFPEEVQQMYLMSERTLATETKLVIDITKGYLTEQVTPNPAVDVKKYWEVIDRTTGEVVSVEQWQVSADFTEVTIQDTIPYHEYTVAYLASMIWDPTQMYNHITNDWGDKPHEIPFDVRQPQSNQFMSSYLEKWLAENPDVNVVRFTTFFYHFSLVFNNLKKEKFVDWFGYGATVSVKALEDFEKAKGYALRPEDFVDEGYYNSTFRVPSPAYLDYIDFIQKFVADEARKLIEITHDANREAMMFLGDNWIGTEPYGKYFGEIGLDAVVGSVGNGTTLRMISEIPHVKYTEGRFLPYFFPDTFYEGNDPTIEAKENWLTARRAILRKPVDRIGYGGYLSLANQFPKFVDYVGEVTEEFRNIYDKIAGKKAYTGVTVGVLNAWGKLRSWQTHMVAHALWYKQIYSYTGILESLSGQKVNVVFMDFEDVKNGALKDVDVVINAGMAGTAYSGGDKWLDAELVARLTKWVADGGGFVGVGQPSAALKNGRFFQMAHVLGVDQELGFSLSTDKYFKATSVDSQIDVSQFTDGEPVCHIYSLAADTEILLEDQDDIKISVHDFGKGKGIYLSSLPYTPENAQLLLKLLFKAAGKSAELYQWYAENPAVEIHYYPEVQEYAIVNNTDLPQRSVIYVDNQVKVVELTAGEIRWEASKDENNH
ncbi:1,3-beta-galactosyl-N-acetylhexosamine phosphorylase [Enterococcus sp. LJL120]